MENFRFPYSNRYCLETFRIETLEHSNELPYLAVDVGLNEPRHIVGVLTREDVRERSVAWLAESVRKENKIPE